MSRNLKSMVVLSAGRVEVVEAIQAKIDEMEARVLPVQHSGRGGYVESNSKATLIKAARRDGANYWEDLSFQSEIGMATRERGMRRSQRK